MIYISPSLLAADFSRLGEEVDRIELLIIQNQEQIKALADELVNG